MPNNTINDKMMNAHVKRKSEIMGILKQLAKTKLAVVGMIIFTIEVILAFLAPLIMPYNFDLMDMGAISQGPSLQHWFGTDELGRDILRPCAVWQPIFSHDGSLCNPD